MQLKESVSVTLLVFGLVVLHPSQKTPQFPILHIIPVKQVTTCHHIKQLMQWVLWVILQLLDPKFQINILSLTSTLCDLSKFLPKMVWRCTESSLRVILYFILSFDYICCCKKDWISCLEEYGVTFSKLPEGGYAFNLESHVRTMAYTSILCEKGKIINPLWKDHQTTQAFTNTSKDKFIFLTHVLISKTDIWVRTFHSSNYTPTQTFT